MASVEERLASLEGRVQEQAIVMADTRGMGSELKESIRDLRQQIDARFQQIDARFQQSDARFDAVREQLDRRFERIDQRFDTINHHLAWLVGIMVTGFIAVIGVLASTASR